MLAFGRVMHGGIVIPGVELVSELGRGAHGAVYRARRGNEFFAVKVALSASDSSAFARFQREAIALARARHPGLPRVLHVAKSGTPYLVMELVEGETLATRLSRGTLDEKETRALALQLADVLAHIHRLGLVHRDIKPRNIIFDDKTGRARIVDFGIAVGGGFQPFAAVEGTVPYAAPEQRRGLSIDGRADLYSLGCVLYECLCGAPPLGPLSLDNLGQAESLSDEAKLEGAGVSPELVRAIVRLMSHDLNQRFAEASDLVETLRASSPEPRRSSRITFSRSSSGCLVGRERELASLQRAWAEVRGGHFRALVVEGAMGSGKTALLQTFSDQVKSEGCAAISLGCSAYDPVPFSVVRQLFDALLELLGEERFRQGACGFESLLAVLSPGLLRLFSNAPSIPDVDDVHHVFLESAAKCLGRLLAQNSQLAILVDDAQWFDAGSAAIFRKLLGGGGVPCLVVLAHRSEPGGAELEVLSGDVRERVSRLCLGPLGDGAVRSLVEAYLGTNSVADDIIGRVSALSTRTPLGVLEALRTFLDARAILPDWTGWRLEPEAAEGVSLPDSVVETLRARIRGLDPLVPEVLVAAATVGMEFDAGGLSELAGRTEEEVSRALREAWRATLVSSAGGRFRFVHQAVREALLSTASEEKLRHLSSLAAELLDRTLREGRESLNSELVYRVADLYFRGDWTRSPARAVEVVESAAQRAFEAYDNRRALLFLEQASAIRRSTGAPANGRTLYLHGEILVRLGSLAAGRELLEQALAQSKDALMRATILSRMAAVCEWELDSTQAWSLLRAAFREIGAEFPDTSAGSLLRSSGSWLRRALGRVPTIAPHDALTRKRQRILCGLYYRTCRIGMLSANIPQTLQAAVLGLEAAQALGVSPALSRAYLAYSLVLTALGQSERGRYYLKQAEDVAHATNDPVAIAYATQLHSVIACWDGKIAEGLEVGSRCLFEHGHWQDFSEHCLLAYNQQRIECVRGRGYEELVWLEHLLRQVALNREAYGLCEYIELGARALLAHLGRAAEAESMLARLKQVTVSTPKTSSHYVLGFGPRARALADVGDVGAEFDALDAEFRHGGHDPRRVHLAVAEYYVHVAHARVHACLRASADSRAQKLEQLRRAAYDLRLAARVPLLKAHSLVVDAYVALFEGDDERSARLFADADALAIEEEAPWVRYAVARGRAHRFKLKERPDIVQSEARRAEQIALENGSVHRLRWVREEFGLSQASTVFTIPARERSTGVQRAGTTFAMTRQERRERARAAVRRAEDRALSLAERRRVFLDELLGGIGAERLHLFSTSAAGKWVWVAGRSRAGADLEPVAVDEFVKQAAAQKLAAMVDDSCSLCSRLAVPILQRGEVDVVVYAEAPGCGVFSAEDSELVSDLVGAFSKFFQFSHGRGERRSDVEALLGQRSASEFARALAEHLDFAAGEAATGASLSRVAALSRLLRDTKRLERCEPSLVNLNEVIGRVGHRMRLLVGAELELLSSLESALVPIVVDAEHVELLVLHCALGASYRTRGRGSLIVETANLVVCEAFAARAPNLREGAHVMLTLSVVGDSEAGVEASGDLERVGFGGLAWQVCRDVALANDGALLGHFEAFGANIQLLFPCGAVLETGASSARSGSETVLVIDRDEKFRSALANDLGRLGYRVLLAEDQEGAAIIREVHAGGIDITVTEAPLEHDERRLRLAAKSREPTIYTSHFPWNAFRAAGVALPRSQFLQKPFAVGALADKIRVLSSERTEQSLARDAG